MIDSSGFFEIPSKKSCSSEFDNFEDMNISKPLIKVIFR